MLVALVPHAPGVAVVLDLDQAIGQAVVLAGADQQRMVDGLTGQPCAFCGDPAEPGSKLCARCEDDERLAAEWKQTA